MTGKELIRNAFEMKEIDRIPWESYGNLPDYIEPMTGVPTFTYAKSPIAAGWENGKRTDEWGSVWYAAEEGVCGEVKEYPITDFSVLKNYRPPYEIFENADLSKVNESCREHSDLFMINQWAPYACSPFQRMQFLRGTEQLFIDLAEEEDGLYEMRDMVHDFYVRQLRLWCRTDIDAIHIEDDWGSQNSLLISPAKWREFFKPLYKEYCDIAHSSGKYVLMHSDGYITDIMEDLIEIGVDAINSQIFCMNMEELESRFGGRICFWGEIDRQQILPFCSDEEIRAEVRRVASIFLKNRKTGLVAMAFTGNDISDAARFSVYDEWHKISVEMFGK